MPLLAGLVGSISAFMAPMVAPLTNRGLAVNQDCIESEKRLSFFWEQTKKTDCALKFQLLTHPVSALEAFKAARNLPRIDARLGNGFEARLIRSKLTRRNLFRTIPLASSGACVLRIPEDGRQYSEGSHMQTLRRKVRASERSGTTCRSILDLSEQADLVRQLDLALATKTNGLYREENADNSALVGTGAWMAAFDANGEPLVLSITPRSGEWALLTLFISFGETPQHSDARYSLTKAAVERLATEGVRYLADERGPSELSNGLRHFQRMLGYRIARVRVI